MGAFFNALTTKGTCYALPQSSGLLFLHEDDAIKAFFSQKSSFLLLFYGKSSTVSRRNATTRQKLTFNRKIPRSYSSSFDQSWKDERLSWFRKYPLVLNSDLLEAVFLLKKLQKMTSNRKKLVKCLEGNTGHWSFDRNYAWENLVFFADYLGKLFSDT